MIECLKRRKLVAWQLAKNAKPTQKKHTYKGGAAHGTLLLLVNAPAGVIYLGSLVAPALDEHLLSHGVLPNASAASAHVRSAWVG